MPRWRRQLPRSGPELPRGKGGRRPYVPHDAEKPVSQGEGLWRGHFGEAQVRSGIPAPEQRSLQADIWWLLDNVLKVDECMDINRNHDQVRMQVARYIRARAVGKGGIKIRALERGKCRIWKIRAGYEKPDP